jgi:hypothetical protein
MLLIRNVEPSLLSCHLCDIGKYHKVLVAIGSNNPVGKKVDYYPAFNIIPHPGVNLRYFSVDMLYQQHEIMSSTI